MNIHLLTYLTNRIFWFYTVYRYNSALYVKEKNPHRWLCYVFSYVIGCCANMCLGTIKGNVIFNLLGLVLIAQSYPADVHQPCKEPPSWTWTDRNRQFPVLCCRKPDGTKTEFKAWLSD